MKHKSLIAKLAIILILTLSFINSFNKTSYLVYADATTDEWTNVTTNEELAEAFRYYCKSRNLAIEGSLLDAVTSFTTHSFTNWCNVLGIDMTALQADIKKSTDKNGGLQFLFNQSGIAAYNRIFAEFLQNNDLSVGDSVDEILEQGEFVLDAEGHGAFVYVVSGLNSNTGATCSAYGSTYKYTSNDLVSIALQNGEGINIPVYFTDRNGTRSISLRYSVYSPKTYITANTSRYDLVGGLIKYIDTANNINKNLSHMAILKNGNNYYCGVACDYSFNKSTGDVSSGHTWFAESNWYFYPYQNKGNQTITINSTEINSNTYTDNRQTVINNEGDVNNYDYDDEDPPVNPPSGGGDTTNVDIDFPNFNFNIPDIDFSLKGLTDKFPFCIPFDMVALLQLLNAEPQAPRIQGQIPFGSFYTWDLDLDFSRFDDFAVIMRGLEFVGFIFFLISATINIAKG